MADTRDKDLTRTSLPALDDVVRLDGATNGTRGILASDLMAPAVARATRGGIASTGASAVGTTPDNPGLAALATGNFTVGMFPRLPDYTPAGTTGLMAKTDGSYTLGVSLNILATGVRRFQLGNGASLTSYVSTVATGLLDGASCFLADTVDRAGNWTPYVNANVLGAPVSIAAQAAQTLANTGPLQWFSNAAGTFGESWIVAGILSASRLADICRAGSIAPFCSWTFNATKGRYVAKVDTLDFIVWPWFDKGYSPGGMIEDRSGGNQVTLIGATGLTHAVSRNPPGTPRRAPGTALVSDGSAGVSLSAKTASQNPSAGDFALWFDLSFASQAHYGGNRAVGGLAPATDLVAARALGVWLGGSGGTGYGPTLYGASSADSRSRLSAALQMLLTDVRHVLIITRNKVLIGVLGELYDATVSFIESTGGSSPPAWTDQIDGQVISAFYRSLSLGVPATVYDLRLYNYDPGEGEWRKEYSNGEPQAKWSGASKIPVYTSDFSTTSHGWNPVRASGIFNQDGISDGTVSKDDCYLVALLSASTSTHFINRPSIVSGGKVYRFTFNYYISASNTELRGLEVGATDSSNGYPTGGTTAFTTVGAWTAASIVVTTTPGQDRIPIWLRNASGQTSFTAATTEGVYLRDIVEESLGLTARLRTDLGAGLTRLNERAENGSSDFLLSASGVTGSPMPPTRTQIIRDKLVFSGGVRDLQIRGAAVIDTTKSWEIVSSWFVPDTPINVSLGSASAGAQYVSAQAVTAAAPKVTAYVTQVLSGANVWVHVTADCTVTVCIRAERMDYL